MTEYEQNVSRTKQKREISEFIYFSLGLESIDFYLCSEIQSQAKYTDLFRPQLAAQELNDDPNRHFI